MSRSLITAAVLAMFAIGCSDGKFNLSLVLWSESEIELSPEIISSSSAEMPPSSSSKAEPPPSSSAPPSQSSSGRGQRSSSSLSQVEFPPPLIEGAPGVEKGWASRYWDGCKPHCSRPEHVENTQPWAICRNCDKNNNEMTAYYLHPDADTDWHGMYLGTPSSCDPHNMNMWEKSPDYNGSASYACWDMIPRIINDTLAYAFAATSMEESYCGKCFQLQFDGGDQFGGLEKAGRDTHRALKGKILVVMSSNVGGEVGKGQFDIMIPGGGLGAFTKGFPPQIGVAEEDLGETMGGLLSTCIYSGDYYETPMEELQKCVREKCNIFNGISEDLKNGCLFMANWYMAADNPTHVYKEVECPKYLVDKYKSTIHTEKPPPLW